MVLNGARRAVINRWLGRVAGSGFDINKRDIPEQEGCNLALGVVEEVEESPERYPGIEAEAVDSGALLIILLPTFGHQSHQKSVPEQWP